MKVFDNKDRNRYYGLRIGDLITRYFAPNDTKIYEVVAYGVMDNNSIGLAEYLNKDAEWLEHVAEWCKVITKVEDRTDYDVRTEP